MPAVSPLPFQARSPTSPQSGLVDPRLRASNEHVLILYISLLGEWPRLPFTARIERAQFHRARSASKKGPGRSPSLIQARLFSSQGWGLIDLPLRASHRKAKA